MVKWLLLQIGDKLGNDMELKQISECGDSCTWHGFMFRLMHQLYIFLRVNACMSFNLKYWTTEPVPWPHFDDDDETWANKCPINDDMRDGYELIDTKILINNILFNDNLNWHNTVGLHRNAIVIGMYVFSDERFAIGDRWDHNCDRL